MILRLLGQQFHRAMARCPGGAEVYLSALSLFSRRLPTNVAAHLASSVNRASWPEVQFRPRRVEVAEGIKIRIIPHLGQPDAEVLFYQQLQYERPVFEWLRQNAGQYDTVIEIGANVGLYTVFFDALIKQQPGNLRTVISFEPAREAYRRLLINLQNNDVGPNITTFQAAVGITSGFQAFYEPTGHICNGSFLSDFAHIFGSDVLETIVPVIGVEELERFLKGKKCLIKIDVEGFEPTLISALKPLIERYRPHLILEVLNATVQQLNDLEILTKRKKFLLTADGPQLAETFFSLPHDRDWLVQPDYPSA